MDSLPQNHILAFSRGQRPNIPRTSGSEISAHLWWQKVGPTLCDFFFFLENAKRGVGTPKQSLAEAKW